MLRPLCPYTRNTPPTTTPITISTIGFLATGTARPDCKLPDEPAVVLASSGAPGVTTSTDVIVVLAPPGSVDTKVDVLGGTVLAVLGVVVVARVEPGVLVATADSEVGEVGEVGKVGESVELVGLATDVSTTVVVDSEGDVGDSEVDSEVRVSWVMLVSVVIATLLESGAWVLVGTAVVSLPDCCLFAIWTIDVASSGSFARMASIAE